MVNKVTFVGFMGGDRPKYSPWICPWLLRQHIWCLGNYLFFGGLTIFMLKWIWWDSEGKYDDFYFW